MHLFLKIPELVKHRARGKLYNFTLNFAFLPPMNLIYLYFSTIIISKVPFWLIRSHTAIISFVLFALAIDRERFRCLLSILTRLVRRSGLIFGTRSISKHF